VPRGRRRLGLKEGRSDTAALLWTEEAKISRDTDRRSTSKRVELTGGTPPRMWGRREHRGDGGLVQVDGRSGDGDLVDSRDPKLTGVASRRPLGSLSSGTSPTSLRQHFPAKRPTHLPQAVDSAGTTNAQGHRSTRSRSPPPQFYLRPLPTVTLSPGQCRLEKRSEVVHRLRFRRPLGCSL
jgi:hypothetical protein